MDLALNNLQRLICHKTQQTKPSLVAGILRHYRDEVGYTFQLQATGQLFGG